jgi:hypothetical protein
VPKPSSKRNLEYLTDLVEDLFAVKPALRAKAAAPAVKGKLAPRPFTVTPKETPGKGTTPPAMAVKPRALPAPNAQMDLQELKNIAAEHPGKVFVRWSSGSKYDMAPGAVSKDYQSGERHAGLSAVPIDGSDTIANIARYAGEYGHFAPEAHVYLGDVVGTDSDGYASIKPLKHLGQLDEAVKQFLNSNGARHLSLTENIANNEKRLTSGQLDPITEKVLRQSNESSKSELAKLGGAPKGFAVKPEQR